MQTLHFNGVLCERKIAIADFDPPLPDDFSSFTHLVCEMRCSSPQRFSIWIHTRAGLRRLMIQPFGQNAWFLASIPLQFFKGHDGRGQDMSSSVNRRTDAFWMSVWGPFGELVDVEAIGFAMEYPVGRPTIELRSARLSNQDEGSVFLEETSLVDEFGQWALADWVGKVKSAEQLQKELDEEDRLLVPLPLREGLGEGYEAVREGDSKTIDPSTFRSPASASYPSPQPSPSRGEGARGFFRVSKLDGVWWFINPAGNKFLSIGMNCIGAPKDAPQSAIDRTSQRLEAWGFNTNGAWCQATGGRRAYTQILHWPGKSETTFLGVPDVYSPEFERMIDDVAKKECGPRKVDPLLLGYFVGNEPPWGGRELEVVERILWGPASATQDRLRSDLSKGDTPSRRAKFVADAFERFLTLASDAIKRHDPNHLNLGIRFAGKPATEVLRLGRLFDVCSINVYEYEPTKNVDRAYRLTGRPVLIGEFHIGVPGNGLGAGLVQAKDQVERAKAYRYFVEQAASLEGFVGAHWFQWRDQPVLGRFDGENYNIGFVDVTDRPYRALVDAAKATHARLHDVHAGKVNPYAIHPLASECGAPMSPW